MSNLMAPRRKGDVLTRLTWILSGIFLVTSLSLAIIAEHRGPAKSILDVPTDSATPALQKTVPAADAKALKSAVPEKKKPAAPISK